VAQVCQPAFEVCPDRHQKIEMLWKRLGLVGNIGFLRLRMFGRSGGTDYLRLRKMFSSLHLKEKGGCVETSGKQKDST
jgi:hypothetical protein